MAEKRPLRKHQVRALADTDRQPGWGLFMDMGTGKSRTLIEDACRAYRRGTIDSVVIFAPKSGYTDWLIKHLEEWMPDDIEWDAYIWEGYHSTKEKREYARFIDGAPCLRWMIVNTEAVSASDRALKLVNHFIARRRPLGAIDESTAIGNPSAGRTKDLLKMRDRFVMRRILTGSPATDSPMKLYSQMEFLERYALGFRSFYAFRARYAKMKPLTIGGRTIDVIDTKAPGGPWQNLEELQQKVARLSTRVLKKDCLDLPPKIYMEPRRFQMGTEQRKIYDSLLKYATAQLSETEHVTATVAIALLTRLHQVACGHTFSENGDLHRIPTPRPSILQEMCEESGGSTIVWCAYRDDVARCVEALSEMGRCVTYIGGQSNDERDRAKAEFMDGTARFFVATEASGSRALTLTVAENVFYYSNTHSLELREQSEDRAHRDGLTHSVTYQDIVAEDSVDEGIIFALREKINISGVVTGDGWRKWII